MRSLCLVFLLLMGFAAGAAEAINSSVGQVGDQIVTARQVWISNFLERWNMARKGSDASLRVPRVDWKPGVKTEAFTQAASSFMLELMVSKEAENFSIAQADASKVEQDTKEFLKSMAGSNEWAKFEANEQEVQKFVDRKARAQNFLKFKTDSAGVTVSDEDAKAYFDKNRLKFGNLPFSQFKESIKEVLSRQQLEERLKDWFEILRRKYRVRFLGQFDG